MSSGTIRVVVQNPAQYPLRNLVIAHHQGKSDGPDVNKTQEFNGIIRKGDPPQYLTATGGPLQYDQYYVHGSDHWVVTWEDHCDLAVYYLIEDPTFLLAFERDLLEAMDKAMEEALENPEILAASDSATASDGPGTAGPSAALLLAQDILAKEKRPAYLRYDINDSDAVLVITLDCGRQTAKFKGKTFQVRCHTYKCTS
jgi:hypothetical protein